jgi:hypothetical protein
VTWRYFDTQGAEAFTGSQQVVADENGLHVKDIKATSKIEIMEGGKTENFAAWLRLGDIWKTKGNFSIPRSDPKKYQDFEDRMRDAMLKLRATDKKISAQEVKGKDVKKLRRRWKEAKAAAVHDPESASLMSEEVANSL